MRASTMGKTQIRAIPTIINIQTYNLDRMATEGIRFNNYDQVHAHTYYPLISFVTAKK